MVIDDNCKKYSKCTTQKDRWVVQKPQKILRLYFKIIQNYLTGYYINNTRVDISVDNNE